MPFYENSDEFTKEHLRLYLIIIHYLEMARSNWQTLDSSIVALMDRKAMKYLHAANLYARISFAKIALEELTAFIAAGSGGLKLRYVTLIPDIFAVRESEAAAFDVKTIQEWTVAALSQHNFLGMVEAAYYPRWPNFNVTRKTTISWHVHLFLWGSPYRKLNADLNPIRDNYRSLIPAVAAAHTKKLATEDVQSQLLYTLKFPQNSYQPYPRKAEAMDRATGEFIKVETGGFPQHKPPMRTGELVRMCRIFEDQYIDRMMFGNREGVALCEAIQRRATASYELEEDRRTNGLRPMSQR